MKSRHFTIVDVPEPQNLTANFVYNFFTPDERVNDAGDPKVKGVKNETLQKLINKNSLQFEVPRYIEINFSQVETFGNSFGDAKNQTFSNQLNIASTNSEETITNIGFSALRENDEDSIKRVREKVNALSSVLGISFEDTTQSKKLADKLKVPQDQIQSLISPLSDPSKLLVNTRKNVRPVSIFELASEAKIVSQINKRLAGACVNSADDASPLSKRTITAEANKISKDFLSKITTAMSKEDVEPIIQTISTERTTAPKQLMSVSAIGYILFRYRIADDGTRKQTQAFFMPGSENTKYLDSQVLYGSCYVYEARAVYQVDAILNGNIQNDLGQDVNDSQNWRVSFFVASRPSSSIRVKTEEFQPPKEPDGVLYNFNYDEERGLIIKWQVPAGRSRDTKYFQIFRRKSIFEPFVCIAQIDFDDSLVRTLLPEQVRPERIFAYAGIKTNFEDVNFTRNDKYIYAVAAVDAHGYSSGYSAQTEVSFNRTKNTLVLKLISRGGAPKQYPNFYVDPREDDNIAVDSFTQDAIFDSGHKKFRIYFTPDARMMKNSNGDSENVFYTDNQQGSYSLHMINLDVQSSDAAALGILDLRKTK